MTTIASRNVIAGSESRDKQPTVSRVKDAPHATNITGNKLISGQCTLDEMVSSKQTPPFQPKVLLKCTGCEWVGKGDHFMFLWNCPPTPPLNPH